MAENLLFLFDFQESIYSKHNSDTLKPTHRHSNPFEESDDKKFKENRDTLLLYLMYDFCWIKRD